MDKKELFELLESRHSVRQFTERKIDGETASVLQKEIDAINAESGLRFVLITENDAVFQANKPHYGNFSGCRNLFALYGGKGEDEKIGYFGERLVLFAQSIGLNTCWVALSYKKNKMPTQPPAGMMLYDVIALGYGKTQGIAHKSKPVEKVSKMTADTPEWFKDGMRAVLLAPTAINQQRFWFEQTGERTVHAKSMIGPCHKTDLGIVKYHFELGAGKENFDWN